MKTFKQFQEEVDKKMPPVKLQGGGGGTNAITDKAKSKTLGNRIKEIGKYGSSDSTYNTEWFKS